MQTDPPLYSRAVAYSSPMEHSALSSVTDGQSQMLHNKRNGRYDDDYPTYQEQKKPMIGYPTKSLTQRRPLSARSYSTETYGASQVVFYGKLLHALKYSHNSWLAKMLKFGVYITHLVHINSIIQLFMFHIFTFCEYFCKCHTEHQYLQLSTGTLVSMFSCSDVRKTLVSHGHHLYLTFLIGEFFYWLKGKLEEDEGVFETERHFMIIEPCYFIFFELPGPSSLQKQNKLSSHGSFFLAVDVKHSQIHFLACSLPAKSVPWGNVVVCGMPCYACCGIFI